MEMAESSGGNGNGNGNGIGIRIPVVYYLSRNRHLEHPHFIEVSLSTPQDDDSDDSDADADADAFFLRDFMERLNQVRGKGMAAMYSWSCKRSYKNGFVWHDLSEDDLILPANGNEYVLKGSELLHPSPSSSPPPVASRPNHTNKTPKPTNQTRPRHDRAANLSRPKLKEPSPSSSASPPPIPNKHSKPLSPLSLSSSLDEQQSPSSLSSGPHSPDQPDIKFHKLVPSADAWTQTEEETVTDSRGFPMDDNLNSAPTNNNRNSCCGKSEMLESLIRAEGRKFNQLRVLEENDDVVFSSGPRLSPASYLMHLITCGSISVKDYRHYEFIPIYRPSYIQPALPSPMYGAGSMRFLTQMEDKEYFSGSIVETKRHIDNTVGDRVPILKRSSSYNAERSCKSSEHWKDETETDDSSRSRCLPRTIKMIASPLSDCPRSSSADPDVRQTPPTGSRRNTTKAMPVVEPSRRKKEKLIKIEERLTSGARVVIQSRVPWDESEDGSDT